jgi:hypothetical protein
MPRLKASLPPRVGTEGHIAQRRHRVTGHRVPHGSAAQAVAKRSRVSQLTKYLMMAKLLGVMTGAALLASVGAANAGQRGALTDAQLDKVVTGDASAVASVANASTVNASTNGGFIFIFLNGVTVKVVPGNTADLSALLDNVAAALTFTLFETPGSATARIAGTFNNQDGPPNTLTLSAFAKLP